MWMDVCLCVVSVHMHETTPRSGAEPWPLHIVPTGRCCSGALNGHFGIATGQVLWELWSGVA